MALAGLQKIAASGTPADDRWFLAGREAACAQREDCLKATLGSPARIDAGAARPPITLVARPAPAGLPAAGTRGLASHCW
jgi:hypothetical protein